MSQGMNVVLLVDTYIGAYDSFVVFYNILELALKRNGVNVFISKSIKEADEIIAANKIDFTINIGQYHYFKNNVALYDIYKITNYQWIIDNPLRYENCDITSNYNRLIFIDETFEQMPNFKRYDFLSLPLPFMQDDSSIETLRSNVIFAPLKIKSEKFFWDLIEMSKDKKHIMDFLSEYQFDIEFNSFFVSFIQNRNIYDLKNFFELVNGLVRIKKRLHILRSIKYHKVIIASDNREDYNFSKNISFVRPMGYFDMLKKQKEHKIILNCNPNFDLCLHDRVSYSVSNGAIVLSDKNRLLDEISFPFSYRYSEMNYLDDKIDECLKMWDLIREKQQTCIKTFGCDYIISKIIDNYNKFKE